MSKNNKILTFFLITIIGFSLTVLFTFPLIQKLGSFYEDGGDYPMLGWGLTYTKSAIETGRIFNLDNFFTPNQFYIFPNSLASGDPAIIPLISFTPLLMIFNNLVFSVNVSAILTLVLNFISSFYVINFFVKNKKASLVGAFIYTFNPLTFSKFPHHLNLLFRFFLPFVFLFCFKYLQSPSFKRSFYFYFFFFLNALSVIYFQIFSVITLPIFALPFLIKNFFNKNYKYFLILLVTSAIALPFLALIFKYDSYFLEFSKKEQIQRSIQENIFNSATLTDWISSTPNNLLYGRFVKLIEPGRPPGKEYNGEFNYTEHTLFLNLSPFFLFLLGALYLFKRRKEKNNRMILLSFSFVLIFSFIMSFGPIFLLNKNSPPDYIKLPYYYLYDLLPLFKGTRVPARFEFIFYIPFSIFAAYGAYYLMSLKKKGQLFLIFLILFVVLENINLHPKDPSNFYSFEKTSYIASKATNYKSKTPQVINILKNKNTFHIPTYIPYIPDQFAKEVKYLTWASYTDENLLNHGRVYIPPDWTKLMKNVNENLRDEDTFKKFKLLDVNYIIIHKELLKNDFPKISDKYFYKNNETVFKNTVFKDDKTIIIDLDKYNFLIKRCNFDIDIQIDLKSANMENGNNFYVLIVENKSDCYLQSFQKERYREKNIYMNNLYGNQVKRTIYYKMPLLILPYEKITLSELNNELRIE